MTDMQYLFDSFLFIENLLNIRGYKHFYFLLISKYNLLIFFIVSKFPKCTRSIFKEFHTLIPINCQDEGQSSVWERGEPEQWVVTDM